MAALIGCLVFVCVFSAALLGGRIRLLLPEHHVSADSRDVVKLGMGLIGTMSALVLSLMVASANGSYQTERAELTKMSANIVLLDRMLAHYGPETAAAREHLRRAVAGTIAKIWPSGDAAADLDPMAASTEGLYEELQKLTPRTDAQRALQSEALKTALDIGQTRWLLFEQNARSIPMPFLGVLTFWLSILFGSFGMLSPRNPTIVATLLVCALSVGGAVFLILELDQPFEGFIHLSSGALQTALGQLGR